MFPYPFLTIGLIILWMLLTHFSLGSFILGAIVATAASWAMAALHPETLRLRKWYLLPKFILIVVVDIIRSNVAVCTIALRPSRRGRRSGFIDLPLESDSPTILAILAIILTATPGSAWLEYDRRKRSVLIHVLDLVNEDDWRDLVKNRYEKLLLEIFA
ncbi:Na+/H+ antiporter subunit E [Limoniibacter endophyticus]|uniref:Na+/H+ antiporter subunit E n=1 Tax=Limoniibacter endophyticus TaxID=1565040 RepID=A0A8J3DLJ4_9HYPH|nr:Na+/H+ antiporter subunit E [Limoniibacter endophyticus]GHC80596.1 Na+/H+ antiporter subunit E [Limoniibacter endophyticus]